MRSKNAYPSAALLLAALLFFLPLPAFGSGNGSDTKLQEKEQVPNIEGLTFEKQLELDYARCVDVYYYEGGYRFFDVYESGQYLLVPEGKAVPAGLDEGVTVILAPVQNIYIAATASMSLFRAIGAMDSIAFSSLEADGWTIPEAARAMEEGKICFAGKYSSPDYEMLVQKNCSLAVESTMILHSPKVKEMLENMGIPVFIDRSSYEPHPLGRPEWAKVYGSLLGKEAEAEAFFAGQAAVMEELKDYGQTGQSVAFFYISMDGCAVVRRCSDYVPKMIEMAGGVYAPQGLSELEGSERSSVSLSMEQFYADALDADYLVYNGTIDSPIGSIEELLAKNALFGDFKAVKEGQVWCAGKELYQATDRVGELIRDFHLMLTGGEEREMTFLRRVS